MKGNKLVVHTNDWSIDSKRSMVDLGYFEDNFISLFSTKKRRSPVINLGYYVRACVMNKVLKYFQHLNVPYYQVISLGAGFDTTFFRIFFNDKNVKYLEIDLQSVVLKKVDILLNNSVTKDLLHNYKVENSEGVPNCLISDNYIILSQNLDNTDQLDVSLKTLGIHYMSPTVIFSECAITYMDESCCTRLTKFLSEKFTNAALLVYEQINSLDGFGQFMTHHFETIQSPLKSLTRYSQAKENPHYYIQNGWEQCFMHRVMDLYLSVVHNDEFMSKIKLEPMDEWEEFHLTCLHYGLYWATNGTLSSFSKGFTETPLTCHFPSEVKLLKWYLYEWKNCVERFGHSVALLKEDKFVVFGGVGIENNCHRKSSIFQIVDIKNKEIRNSETSLNQFALMHMASCNFEIENSSVCFFVHGGSKAPGRLGDSNPYIILYEAPSSFLLHQIIVTEDSKKPCHRWRHSAISFGPNIFLFGGRTSDLTVLDDFWKLSLARTQTGWSGTWTHLDGGPLGRFSHGCVSVPGGGLIISGGINSYLQPLDDCWRWDPKLGWSRLQIASSVPRYGHTCHLLFNKMFLIGGVTFHPDNPGVTVIDLEHNSASHFSLPDSSPIHFIMLHNHQSVLSQDQREIIIVGGGGNCFSFGTSFNKCIVNIPIDQFLS